MPPKGRPKSVVYPGNVQEISSDLGTNELVRRLKQLVEALRDIDQIPEEAAKYKPLATHLASEFFMQNENRQVRILVACAIADILRIFAPDAPYGDADVLKNVLIFLIKQLNGLTTSPADPMFNQRFLLLENLAIVKTLNIVLELEDCDDILVIMFKMFFGVILHEEKESSEKIQNLLVDVMAHILKDVDHLSIKVLDALLINLIEPHKTQSRVSYKCAKEVVTLCSSAIQPFLEAYLLNAISDSELSESELKQHVFEIIYEIYKIIPQIMSLIMSQLEDKIRSSEKKERLETVRLLSKLFADKDSAVYEECPSLWSLFLTRFQDIESDVRLQCIKSSVELLVIHPKLRNDITECLIHRCKDPDDNVRSQMISLLSMAVKRDLRSISDNLLMCIKERTLDSSLKVRQEAITCLGAVYRKIILSVDKTNEDKKVVSWIKNKLLHVYYQPKLDDKILCEKVLNTCLVPYVLETDKRMEILFELACTVDENAIKAFYEIFRQQSAIRSVMRDILQCKHSENEDSTDVQIQKLKILSTFFLDGKALDHLTNFYEFLVDDAYALRLVRYIMGENYTTAKIQNAVKELLMKVGPQTKFANLHPIVRALLERAAPMLVDTEAVQFIVDKVRLSLEGVHYEFIEDVSEEQISERGLNLLMLFASSFSSCFWNEEVLGTLMTFLRDGHALAADMVIQIFTRIGRHNEADFSNVFSCLLPELKKIAETGTPKQAKHAINCITTLWPKQDSVLEEILEVVKDQVNFKSAHVQTAFATLSTIAVLRPVAFHDQLKALVPTAVVRNILLSEENHSNLDNDDEQWKDVAYISIEAKAKISAIKFLVRRLLGMKTNEDNHGTNTIRLLCRLIENNGNLHSIEMSSVDRSHLKLAAACGLLKLLQQQMFSELLTLDQFVTTAFMIVDDCRQVREKFAVKLHRGLMTTKLPLYFMATCSLVPLIKKKAVKNEVKAGLLKTDFVEQVRESIVLNIKRRKELLKKRPEFQNRPDKFLPEYYLSFVIYLLAHHPDFGSRRDVKVLRNLRECVWFAIDPLVNQPDSDKANYQFLYKMLQDIKHTKDAETPDDDVQNEKMWALCDLGMLLLTTRGRNFEIRNSAHKSILSKKFFLQPETKKTVTNTKVFLPAEIVDEEKRSHGDKRQAKKHKSST